MTLDDYMSSEKFPTTTQDYLSPLDQFFIDNVNYDALQQLKWEGGQFDNKQNQIWDELSQKILAQAGLKEEAKIASEAYDDSY